MNKQNKPNKPLRIILYSFIIFFAIIGFGFSIVFIANSIKKSNSMNIDERLYSDLLNENDNNEIDSNKNELSKNSSLNYQKMLIINKFYPANATIILESIKTKIDDNTISKMISVVEMKLHSNKEYTSLTKAAENLLNKEVEKPSSSNCFFWMNISEWSTLKKAISKEKKLIDSVSTITGVEPRLLVSCVVAEQIRLINVKEENKKSFIKLVSGSSKKKMNLGITGVSDAMAIKIESNLKSSNSEYYLGEKFKKLIKYNSEEEEPSEIRYSRLMSNKKHYYTYLYAGLYLHQIKKQWERAGFDISNRPEILATLFSLGFESSKPNSSPKIGGETFQYGGKTYVFGEIAFDFYYSGELIKDFPIKKDKFSL